MGLKSNQTTFLDEASLYIDDCISSANIGIEKDQAKEKMAAESKHVYVINRPHWIGLKTVINGRSKLHFCN